MLQNLEVNNTNNVPVAGTAINALFPTMGAGPRFIFLGKAGSVNDSAVISFSYVSAGSTSNTMGLGLFGLNQFVIYPSTGFVTPASGTITAFQVAASLVVLNSTVANSVTLNASAATTPYSFRLPTTAGTAGQVLTSQGASAMTWTNPTSGGTVTGITTTGSSANLGIVVGGTAAVPNIAITPLVTGTGNFVLAVAPTLTGTTTLGSIVVNGSAASPVSGTAISALDPVMISGSRFLFLGRDGSLNNCITINFNYASSGSTLNFVGMGLYGANQMTIYPDSGVFAIPSTGCVTSNIFRANGFQSSAGNRAFQVFGTNPSILITNTVADIAEIGVASSVSAFVTGSAIGDLCLSVPTGKSLRISSNIIVGSNIITTVPNYAAYSLTSTSPAPQMAWTAIKNWTNLQLHGLTLTYTPATGVFQNNLAFGVAVTVSYQCERGGTLGKCNFRICVNNTDVWGYTENITLIKMSGSSTIYLLSGWYFTIEGYNETLFGEDFLVGCNMNYVIH